MAQVPGLDVMMNGPYITQTAPIRENLCESCGSLWSFPLSALSARQAPVNKATPSSFPWAQSQVLLYLRPVRPVKVHCRGGKQNPSKQAHFSCHFCPWNSLPLLKNQHA